MGQEAGSTGKSRGGECGGCAGRGGGCGWGVGKGREINIQQGGGALGMVRSQQVGVEEAGDMLGWIWQCVVIVFFVRQQGFVRLKDSKAVGNIDKDRHQRCLLCCYCLKLSSCPLHFSSVGCLIIRRNCTHWHTSPGNCGWFWVCTYVVSVKPWCQLVRQDAVVHVTAKRVRGGWLLDQ